MIADSLMLGVTFFAWSILAAPDQKISSGVSEQIARFACDGEGWLINWRTA
jgi:hypothetical protein